MSRILVDQIRSNSASADAMTLDGSGNVTFPANVTCSGTATGFGGRLQNNLIVNGAMNVAQRLDSQTTSSTTSGYGSVDRFACEYSGTDEAPTHTQADVASGTTPYTLGFRKALKVTNGNQTGGAGTSDRLTIIYKVEAQDIATSGWNYLSSSSYVTFSFWVKSSVAQNFYNTFKNDDGTSQRYVTETSSLTADTWTKITKTFSGDSNITINNDNSVEFNFYLVPFYGTDLTASGVSLTAWNTYDATALMPDNTSTWYTTNDATLEITGVQLEVGPQATAFEHLSKAEELTLCQRYCEVILEGESDGAYMSTSVAYTTNQLYSIFRFKVEKRVSPTLVHTTGTNYYINYRDSSGINFDGFNGLSWPNTRATGIYQSSTSFVSGQAGLLGSSNSNALVLVTAEL